MNNEINNQQMQNPSNMSFPIPSANVIPMPPVIPQSQNGKWEAVDPSMLGFTISGDMNRPVQGPDGSFYCISNSMPEYGSIQANQSNAVPTPSSIIQLPPIVQPIAMVPYASQNQPLLQYDPNYRPQEPQTPQSPKYRLKPYKGISFVQVLCALGIMAMLILLVIVNGKNTAGSTIDWTTYRSTGLDAIYGLMSLLGIGSMTSVYYNTLLQGHFAGGIGAGFSTDFVLSLCYILIPAFLAIILIVAFILIIKYISKMARMKSPRGFSIGALIIFCLSGATIAMIFAISKKESMNLEPGIAIYAITAISLFMIIFSFFARKNAYILDELALKRVYIINDEDRN